MSGVKIPEDVQHKLPVRLVNLGLGRHGLFYLWEETGLLAANDCWCPDDGGLVLFLRVDDVAGVHGADGGRVFFAPKRVLTRSVSLELGPFHNGLLR